MHFPEEQKTYLETYPDISNDTEQHKRNPCQPALNFDHNELPGEHNPAKQNLDKEWSRKGQGENCEKHKGKSTTGEKPLVRKENQKR